MEYSELKSLDNYVKSHFPLSTPLSFIEHVFTFVGQGLWYLHGEKSIIHRDIKPENILCFKGEVDRETNPHGYPRLKISDFGVSKIVDSIEIDNKTRLVGTPDFMAPEMIAETEEYTYKCDLWSFGVMLYHLITRNFPFHHQSWHLAFKQMNLHIPTQSIHWDDKKDMKEVVSHLLIVNDFERWGWPEIFRNKYTKALMKESAKNEIDFSKLRKIAYKKRPIEALRFADYETLEKLDELEQSMNNPSGENTPQQE